MTVLWFLLSPEDSVGKQAGFVRSVSFCFADFCSFSLPCLAVAEILRSESLYYPVYVVVACRDRLEDTQITFGCRLDCTQKYGSLRSAWLRKEYLLTFLLACTARC